MRIDVLALLVALASAGFAYILWRTSKRSLTHQALLHVQDQYRSGEMLCAVRRLWEFYKEHGADKFVQKYEDIREADRKRIKELQEKGDAGWIVIEQATLHYHRRLVSQFYQHLASLKVNKILSKDIIYSSWSERDLRIISNVIVPIENRLGGLHTPPRKPMYNSDPLLILYNDSRTYEASRDC